MTRHLISLVGATSIGKTKVSIALAKHFGCAIVSCDSRQFYKEMTIGTAAPTPEELLEVSHYFIQDRSIHQDYNVGQFEREALNLLNRLFTKQKIAIMVGGSGLYIDAVLKGLDAFPPVAPQIREKLNERLQKEGLDILVEELRTEDPITYTEIDKKNPHRVLRALEVCIGSDKAYSFYKEQPKIPRNFSAIKIGLDAPREVIYQRIEKRVDEMIVSGFVEEARTLHPHKNLNALQTVGYKELFDYFEGKYTLEAAIAEIKKNTRRYAKRQNTWFKKDTDIQWFDYNEDIKNIIKFVRQNLK